MKAVLPWFDYRFSDAGLEIALGKLVLARTSYTDIAAVKPIAPPSMPSWKALKQRAQAFVKRPVVAVRRSNGWLRRWLIAPEDPAAFVKELEKRVAAAKRDAEAETPPPIKKAASAA